MEKKVSFEMAPKKSTTSQKRAAAGAPRSNGSPKTASRVRGKTASGSALSQSTKRDAKAGAMTTKEVTLLAFRRTYDRLHPRKDK